MNSARLTTENVILNLNISRLTVRGLDVRHRSRLQTAFQDRLSQILREPGFVQSLAQLAQSGQLTIPPLQLQDSPETTGRALGIALAEAIGTTLRHSHSEPRNGVGRRPEPQPEQGGKRE